MPMVARRTPLAAWAETIDETPTLNIAPRPMALVPTGHAAMAIARFWLSGSEGGVDVELLREAGLVAGEATRARETVAANLLRIACTVDALVTECLEECRLQREREDVEHAALDRQRFHGGDDVASQPVPLRFPGDGDRRHFGNGWRVLLEGAAGHDPAPRIHGNQIIVDLERDLLRCTPQHEVFGGEDVVQPRDLLRLAFAGGTDE